MLKNLNYYTFKAHIKSAEMQSFIAEIKSNMHIYTQDIQVDLTIAWSERCFHPLWE